MPKLLLFLSGFLLLSSLSAQNKCLEQLDQEGIFLRSEFWRGLTFVKGTQSSSVGFAFNKIEPEFDNASVARKMFKKAQKSNKVAFGFGMASLAGMTVGLIVAERAFDADGNGVNNRTLRKGMAIMLGSAALSFAVSVPLRIHSERQLSDAVWQRNREMMQ